MYEELQLALQDLITPERLEVLLDMHRLLVELGAQDHEDELQQIFGLQDGISDSDLLISRIEACLVIACGQALREYGVVLRDDAPPAVMLAVLQSVSQVEYYVIPETLRDLLLSQDSPEEILARMVPLFSAIDEDRCLTYLHQVDPRTLKRLEQIAEDNIAQWRELPPPKVDVAQRATLINQLYRATGETAPALTLELAKSGVRMGTPLAELMELTLDDLDEKTTELVAVELMGLLLYSDTDLTHSWAEYRQLVRDFTDDYEEQTRIDTTARRWFTEIGHA